MSQCWCCQCSSGNSAGSATYLETARALRCEFCAPELGRTPLPQLVSLMVMVLMGRMRRSKKEGEKDKDEDDEDDTDTDDTDDIDNMDSTY